MMRRTRSYTLSLPACLSLLVWFLTWPGIILAQPRDICGCSNHPQNLGTFDSSDERTYPPGTTRAGSTITISVPAVADAGLSANGILVFSRFTVARSPTGNVVTVRFVHDADRPSASNTPVTLLVTGDVMIDQNATLSINGEPGDHGSIGGTGGQGGPGGFRGGDGANPTVNGANDGGAGFGPGGGEPGTAALVQSGNPGRYVNVGELLPLVGGSGGGGGAATGAQTNCAGGGGGGGGGALLIAANGTITINGTLTANGGRGGSRSGVAACASGGGGGSGGAIRLLADTIAGSRPVFARGGINAEGTVQASDGAVRLEAFTNTLPVSITDTPQAVRVSAPGRLVHPLMPTIAITAVNGQPISPRTRGPFGRVDVSMLPPGPLIIALHTSGVPRGTIVQVSVKSQVGGTLIPGTATLTLCDSAGDCDITVEVNVPALPDTRAYFIEAQATFQTP